MNRPINSTSDKQPFVADARSRLMNANETAQNIINQQSAFFARMFSEPAPGQSLGGEVKDEVCYGGVRGVHEEIEILHQRLETIRQNTARLGDIG